MSDTRYVLAVDPGKLTGVAVFLYDFDTDDAPELISSAELNREELEAWLEFLFVDVGLRGLDVVAERYKLSEADAPWSLQTLGVLSYLSRKAGFGEPELQTPADAKAFCTNDRLKHLGYWHVGGEGHALDAIRHGVLYMVRKKLLDAKLTVM